MTTTIQMSPERAMIATAITALDNDARATSAASSARGYTEGSSFNLRRPNGTGFLDVISDICIDAHQCAATELRDLASSYYEAYHARPGIVTTDEVAAACAEMRIALER
jgi:hypothetical protein